MADTQIKDPPNVGAVVTTAAAALNPVPKVTAAIDTLGGLGPAITKLGSDAASLMVTLAFFIVGMLILLRRQVTPVAKTAIKAAVPGGKAAAVAGVIT